jgi:tetratricopeptide (TPR) repeat protein
MKITVLAGWAFALLLVAGCGKKEPEITELQRKEAASLVTEADFAITLRDFARAEPLLEKAATLCPDMGDYWLSLGVVRKKQGNNSGAKSAYENAREAFHEAYEKDANHVRAVIQEIHVLILLGEQDDARDVLAKARKKAPDNRDLRMFDESKELDRLAEDPSLKQLAI